MSMICLAFRPRHSLFAALAFAGLAPTPALADALQQQVLAGAKLVTEDDFAFTQTTVNQRSGSPDKEFVLRFDPKRAKGSRWTLQSVDGRAPTAKEASTFAKRSNAGRVPSYAEIAKWFGAPATRVGSDKTSVTYQFASLPPGTVKMPGQDMSPHISAEAVVNIASTTPFVERVRFTSNKPVRMMMVARIERFITVATYQMQPNGRPAPLGSIMDMTGSMMGKAGSFKLRTRFSDWRWVR